MAPVKQALALIEARRLREADAHLEDVLRLARTERDRFEIERLRWQVARGAGDVAGEERALRAVAGTGLLEPGDAAQAWRGLATMARKRGDLARALADMDAALALAPEDGAAWANAAAMAQRAGELERARTYMRRAVAAERAAGRSAPEMWREFVEERTATR